MEPRYFPGAFYAVALPGGYFMVLHMDGRVVINEQTWTPPDGRAPLYPDMTKVDGRLRVCGQGWTGGEAVEWEAMKGWRILPAIARGAGGGPAVYDRAGILHVEVAPEEDGTPPAVEGVQYHHRQNVGSQGWRYCATDNGLVTGDATYVPSALAPRLHEWTAIDEHDLVIGQGDHGGVLVYDRRTKTHHALVPAPADCRKVTVRWEFEQVAIAWWGKNPDTPTGIVWTTVDALRALSLDDSAVEVPSPPSVPTPPHEDPPPTPEVPLDIIVLNDDFPRSMVTPALVSMEYRLDGLQGESVTVQLTVNGMVQDPNSDRPEGTLTVELTEPGEYRMGIRATSTSRRNETGRERMVRVQAAPEAPVPPVLPPAKTGREGFTQAADEARAELEADKARGAK